MTQRQPEPTEPQSTRSPDALAGLVERAQAGERRAFDQLAQALAPVIYRVIGALVKDPDDRADLMQEALYRAYRSLGSFRPGAPVTPWMATIAANAARDHLRRLGRWRTVSLDETPALEPEVALCAAQANALDALATRDHLARVDEAFQSLTEEHRAVLWLRAGEGLSYEEIASALDLPRGTVMSRLSRARRLLRAALAGAALEQGETP